MAILPSSLGVLFFFLSITILPAQKTIPRVHPQDPLAHWRVARRSGTATIVVIGDSISGGAGTVFPNGYVDRLKVFYGSVVGDTGYGYVMPDVLAAVGNWETDGFYAPIIDGLKGTAQATLSFSSNSLIDAVEIFYAWMPDSAPFTVWIDDAPTVISDATPGVNRAMLPVPSGDHKITITAPPNGYLYFLGASVEHGTTGVRIHDLKYAGHRALDAGVGNRLDVLDLLKPDLTIIAMGVNDRGESVADYTAAMLYIIAKAKSFGSVLIVSENPTTDPAALPDGIAARPAIIDVDQTLADSTHSARIDMFDLWGGTWKTADDLGFMSPDRIHPSAAGHANYADTILKVIESIPRQRRALLPSTGREQ
jgi:lysophospholipase L1-like esterase